MSSLKSNFLGIEFPNPFVLASGPPTADGKMIKDAFKAGWGGAVLKTIGLEPTPVPSPRLHVIKEGRNKIGMLNYELITLLTVDEWCDEIASIRADYPDRPLIASIMGGGRPNDWQEIVRRIEPQGVNAFELNVSCPNYSEERGAQLGQDPEALAMTVQWVKEATRLPVIVKLTPNVTDITKLAKAARDAGADAITATNTLSGLGGINLEDFSPLPTVDQVGIFGGYSGPGLRPVALRAVASIGQAIDLPLIGCGGVARWEDAAEFIAVGAGLVQVCTAVMWNGYGLVDKLTKGLEKYLDAHGYATLEEIRGRALEKIVKFPGLNLDVRFVASIDAAGCNGCNICLRACQSGGFDAIESLDNKKVVVDIFKCDGCGLCVGVCPFGVITLVPRPVERRA